MAVPLNAPSSPESERFLRSLEAERKRNAEERITGWTVVWTLFAFKLGTIIIIWFAAGGSAEAKAYIAVTSWYWLGIPIAAMSGLIAYRWRLRKARRQVSQLRQSEFSSRQDGDRSIRFSDEELREFMAMERRREELRRSGER
ncbi:MAG TPA: hypothetical protein VGR29_04610 [Thermomicrobiales bacterium]|nr:hypothetical protein [Thermomicrobiales bacterium]